MNQREAVKLSGLDLTHAALEVLARIAFKRPISQEEIDRFFDADKGGWCKLRDLKLVEEFSGADGRLCFRSQEDCGPVPGH